MGGRWGGRGESTGGVEGGSRVVDGGVEGYREGVQAREGQGRVKGASRMIERRSRAVDGTSRGVVEVRSMGCVEWEVDGGRGGRGDCRRGWSKGVVEEGGRRGWSKGWSKRVVEAGGRSGWSKGWSKGIEGDPGRVDGDRG